MMKQGDQHTVYVGTNGVSKEIHRLFIGQRSAAEWLSVRDERPQRRVFKAELVISEEMALPFPSPCLVPKSSKED